LVTLLTATQARAQTGCPTWTDGFELSGVLFEARATAVFDDGSGPALYVAGDFSSAGGFPADRIARWDGTSWSAVGAGLSGSNLGVYALAVFDDGTGPALYATGRFDSSGGVALSDIARWDGTSWSDVGGGVFSTGTSLAVFDDGTGPALYIGGVTQAGAITSTGVLRWDGTSYSGVEGGILPIGTYSLEVFDDGSGPALYAGGDAYWNGTTLPGIARWDGVEWSAVGTVDVEWVRTLEVFDDGTGPALFAGAEFDFLGTGAHEDRVGVWDGTSWTPVGSSAFGGTIQELAEYDDGSGAALYAGGSFPGGLARWDTPLWSNPAPAVSGNQSAIFSLTGFDDGSGTRLFAAGKFMTAGAVGAYGVAAWDGTDWAELGESGASKTTSSLALEVHDDGSGPALYAGGANHYMGYAGGLKDRGLLRFDGTSWSDVGEGVVGSVRSLHSYDDGSGPALIVGGLFASVGGSNLLGALNIARWKDGAWSNIGNMTYASQSVNALATFDDGNGPALFAGGGFLQVNGVVIRRLARWDGSSWSPVASHIDRVIHALEVFDDGTGPVLIAGGGLMLVNTLGVGRIASWDGTTWSAMGGGISHVGGAAVVNALAVHDDGTGPALYVAGTFDQAGGVPAVNIARWDGTNWSAVGTTGFDGGMSSLEVHDDLSGTGPALFASGSFTSVDGVVVNGIAKWDGVSWTALEQGVAPSTYVAALASFDDGNGFGPALFAAGAFTQAGSVSSGNIARWGIEEPCTPTTYCTAKVNSLGCTPAIGWSGTHASVSQASGFNITSSNTLDNKSGLFFYGYEKKAAPYQGGWLCVQAPARRTALQNSGGSAPCGGLFSFDFNAHMASGTDPALIVGASVYGQYWSRDPQASFNTNRTDAISFLVNP
jgi:hypothetical protein